MKFTPLIVLVFLTACASLDEQSLYLQPGMSKQQVVEHLGVPVNRSFRGTDEAWQYQEVVGFGQCSYITAWFSEGELLALTTRRGDSVAGCGLGSREVDWGQMPKPTVEVKISSNQ